MIKVWDIVQPKDKWEEQYAWLEYLRVGITKTFSTQIEVLDEEDIYNDLLDEALQNVCACYKPYLLTGGAPTDELEAIIEDPYYLHHEEGEDWHNCPEWATDRAESLADEQIMRARGK